MNNSKTELFNLLLKGNANLPYMLFRPILMHFAARFNGNTYGEFASDYKVLVEANIKAMEYFDLDMVGLISDPYRETSAFGAPIEYQPEGVPKCLKTMVSLGDDLTGLKNPNVRMCERTLDRIKGAAYFQEILKGSVPVIGWIEGPLAEVSDLMGMGEVMMQLLLDPDFMNRFMDIVMTTAKDFAKAQIEEGCQVIGMGDAVCSQIDVDTYKTFVKDRHSEIIDHIHSLGARVKLHICGDITHLLSELKDTGADIVDLDWQVDMEKAFQLLGPDIIRCGNINPVDIQNKTSDEIFEMTHKLVENERGRNFILSGGCEITVNTPHENLMAMRKASK